MSRPDNPAAIAADRSVLELARIVSLAEAARIIGISEDGIRRHHSRLIRRLSPRRVGIRLGDLLEIGTDLKLRNTKRRRLVATPFAACSPT